MRTYMRETPRALNGGGPQPTNEQLICMRIVTSEETIIVTRWITSQIAQNAWKMVLLIIKN